MYVPHRLLRAGIVLLLCCVLAGCTAVPVMLPHDRPEETVETAQTDVTADPLLPSDRSAEEMEVPCETASFLEVDLPADDYSSYISLPVPVGLHVEDVDLSCLSAVRVEYVYDYHPTPAGTIVDLSFSGIRRGTEVLLEPASLLKLHVSVGVNPANVTVPEGDKTVYLTFDDGPHPVNTASILDTLDQYGIQATFFLVGTSVEKYPDMVREIYSRGHKIGCHSYSHVYKDIYRNAESMLAEIRKWEEAVEGVLGFVPEERLFRFPGGSTMCGGSDIPEAVAAEGYRAFDWNALDNDSLLPSKPKDVSDEAFMQEAVIATLKYSFTLKTSPHIVLAHDTYKQTADLLPWMIDYMLEKGYTFSTLDTLESGWLHGSK